MGPALINAVFLLIFAACIGFAFADGLWSNALRLVNALTAALLATNFWEPLADWFDGLAPSYTYVWDFIALWGLFIVIFSLLRLATDLASRVKVRFLKVVDRAGSLVLAACLGWVMVCFTAMSLHTAPLARNFLFGGFDPQSDRLFLGVAAPDRQWLAFVQRLSLGAYCRAASAEQWKEEATVFDPGGAFIPKYATRRARLEGHMGQPGTRSLRVAE